MATFCGHHSLGFGDPYGDGLRVLAAAGAVSFIDLAVLARINKGWQGQVNDWRATVQIVSLREIEFEKFGLPKDTDEAAFWAMYNDFIRQHNMDPWAVPLPERWCFGEMIKAADRRRWMASVADPAVRVILRFYRGLKTLDMRGVAVSSDLLLRLPVACPQLTLLDTRGSPAGEQYEHYFTEPPQPDSEWYNDWVPLETWAKPCGLASGVTRQLRESMPNLKIQASVILFQVSEDEDGGDLNRADFRAYTNTPLQRVFDAYAMRIGVPVDQLRFEHYDEQCEWKIVEGDDTPSTIDMDPDIRDLLWARRLPLPPTPGPHELIAAAEAVEVVAE